MFCTNAPKCPENFLLQENPQCLTEIRKAHAGATVSLGDLVASVLPPQGTEDSLICWIFGHRELSGNETVDYFAKESARLENVRSERALSIASLHHAALFSWQDEWPQTLSNKLLVVNLTCRCGAPAIAATDLRKLVREPWD